MIIYFDVYDYEGKWVGFAQTEWEADNFACDVCGYFVERHEDLDIDF